MGFYFVLCDASMTVYLGNLAREIARNWKLINHNFTVGKFTAVKQFRVLPVFGDALPIEVLLYLKLFLHLFLSTFAPQYVISKFYMQIFIFTKECWIKNTSVL